MILCFIELQACRAINHWIHFEIKFVICVGLKSQFSLPLVIDIGPLFLLRSLRRLYVLPTRSVVVVFYDVLGCLLTDKNVTLVLDLGTFYQKFRGVAYSLNGAT